MSNKVYQELRDMYEYCQNPDCGSTSYLEIHHIVFRSQGGKDEPDNLVLLCRECHMRAHGRMVAGKDPIIVCLIKGKLRITEVEGGTVTFPDCTPHFPTELDGTEYFNLNERIKVNEAKFKKSGTDLGKDLAYMYESGLYKGSNKDWASYLLDNLTIGYKMANRLRANAEGQAKYALPDEAVGDISVDKLSAVYSAAKTKPDMIREFIEIAQTTPGLDETKSRIRAKYLSKPEPEYDFEKPRQENICPTCGLGVPR